MVHSPSFSLPNWHRVLLQVVRLPFWFACFWAIAGVAWRPPLASVGLVALFLLLCVAIEWASRRLSVKKLSKTNSTEPVDETVRQQMIRSKTSEGLDRLEGTFWAEFPEDAMTTTVHIPFCPAFERTPKVQVFPVDETDAQLRITLQKTFGVRVDIKRNTVEIDRLCFALTAEG